MSRIKYYDSTTQTWKYSDLAVQNPLPVGTNNGDILVWDATEQEWIVKSEFDMYYIPLTYIESTGTQFFDTELSPTSDVDIEFECFVNSSQSNYAYIFGSRGEDFATDRFIMNASSEAQYGNVCEIWRPDQIRTADIRGHKVKFKTSGLNLKLYIDDVLHTDANFVGPMPDDVSSAHFFSFNGNTLQKAQAKLYYLKMWKDGTLVRDFVPAVNRTSASAGMYDMVNRKFHPNLGSGEFLKGEVVNS